jgi:hypothetical protein
MKKLTQDPRTEPLKHERSKTKYKFEPCYSAKEQDEFKRLTLELQKWMQKHCHPHMKVVVAGGYAEIAESVLCV